MVVPIEVKGGNTRANSLKSLMKNHKDISYGYKFADGNIGVGEDGIITLPLYMIAFISFIHLPRLAPPQRRCEIFSVNSDLL